MWKLVLNDAFVAMTKQKIIIDINQVQPHWTWPKVITKEEREYQKYTVNLLSRTELSLFSTSFVKIGGQYCFHQWMSGEMSIPLCFLSALLNLPFFLFEITNT